MGSSRRDFFIDVFVDRFIFKNNRIVLSPCYTFVSKTGVGGLRKTVVSFYCAGNRFLKLDVLIFFRQKYLDFP